MRSVSITILLSLFPHAHPNDSIDKLGDKLTATLTKSLDKLSDTLANSVDKLGDTLADKLGDRLADRAFMMQSSHPEEFDDTVHAKPGAGPQAGHGGFPAPSLKSPVLRGPLATKPAMPARQSPKASIGRVDLRDLYNPVHTAAESKALSGAGLGYHVRRPASFSKKEAVGIAGIVGQEARASAASGREEDMKVQRKPQDDETAQGDEAFYEPDMLPEHAFKFSPSALDFAPRAFESPQKTHPVDTHGNSDIDIGTMKIPEVPKAWAFTHPEFAALKKTLEVPAKSPFKFSPDAREFVPRDFESSPKSPPVDIDTVVSEIDKDISNSLRRKAPPKHPRSWFSFNAPELVPSQ